MPGRIRAEDVATVKERTSIESVVSEHVTLRRSGSSLKGLCPFHDEKSPSFNVNASTNSYHCFGCGQGGDVLSFVQAVEHLSFTEAVERLAGRLGMELHYEDGGGRGRGEGGLGRRSRLVEAHRAAAELYAASLVELPEARAGRDFLRERGFERTAAERFGVGFSPRAGEELTRALRAKGFTDDELTTAGLSGRGSRGLYDRFRGRLMWPIRDITGDVVGFGARRLFDDDRVEAKYLNTSETPIYRKASVLYGLDAAKKAIARDRQAVVVEGYTDVMACHLSGVETAVATCGTAFGIEHIKLLRRLMRDERDQTPAKVVFTFDGDAAGQKAAMRAFEDDQRWASQSFVAVAPSGQDPCELRQAEGEAAVRALVEDAVPMFEFAVRTTIERFDLATAEGRVQAGRAVAPIIAGIRDEGLRPEYTRTVAGWLGLEVGQVAAEVGRATRTTRRGRGSGDTGTSRRPPERPARDDTPPTTGTVDPVDVEHAFVLPRPDLRDPLIFAERQLLQAVLQHPDLVDAEDLDAVEPGDFRAPAHRTLYDAIRAAGGPARASGTSAAAWTAKVADAASSAVRPLVSELAVAPLPTKLDPATGAPDPRYVTELLVRVREVALNRRIADALSTLRRLDAGDAATAREVARDLQALQRAQAELRERLS